MTEEKADQTEELKRLSELCRQGQLFEVQEWIAAGRPYRNLTEDRRIVCPFRVAVQTGFHSLIEVFLEAGVAQEQMDRAFHDAFRRKRLDLMGLLLRYGANIESLCEQQITSCHSPAVQGFLTDNGLNWDINFRILKSFQSGVRGFLRTFLRIRSSVPSAEHQAAMALRHFVQKNAAGSIALLLWAKVNPRLEVPDPEISEDIASPLTDMVRYGDIESIKKVGLDRQVDDPTRLLHQYFSNPKPAVIGMLLGMGARINDSTLETSPVQMLFEQWSWKYLGYGGGRSATRQAAVDCLLLLAARGAKWDPRDKSEIRMRRRSILDLPAHEARSGLKQLIEAGLFPDDVLQELLKTPAIKKHVGKLAGR